MWAEGRISYVEPSVTPIKFVEIQFLSLSPQINLYRILSTVLKIIYYSLQRTSLLLFSRAEQSFSSCTPATAVSTDRKQLPRHEVQLALDGLSLTSRVLHILLQGLFDVSHRHHPLWAFVACSRENLTCICTCTFTQVPSSSNPYSLNCTTLLNLTPILSALVQWSTLSVLQHVLKEIDSKTVHCREEVHTFV